MARGGVWLALGCSLAVFGLACGSSPGTIPTCTVGGTVTGLTGAPTALVLQNNGGDDLTVAANGSFTFPSSLGKGETFQVTVKTQPTCPGYTCTISGGNGTAIASITGVTVTCALNSKVTLFAANWDEASIYATDDVDAVADGATASPRSITGASTGIGTLSGIDSLVADRTRNLIYVSNPDTAEILVFGDALQVQGDVAPVRKITLPISSNPAGLALDPGPHDRLYVATDAGLMILSGASTASGDTAPAVVIPATTSFLPRALDLDRKRDRLFVTDFSNEKILIFDGAATLTSASTPSRSISMPDYHPEAVAIDACTDRLYVGVVYLGSESFTPFPPAVLVFGDAGTANGTLGTDLPATANIPMSGPVLALTLDDGDRLYTLFESARDVTIRENASSMSGTVSDSGKTVQGVAKSSYGVDFASHR
jgi:hypothetical protein